ncbi:MAG: hypothetical protein ACOYK9_01015 [Chlamydiia bacterium]
MSVCLGYISNIQEITNDYAAREGRRIPNQWGASQDVCYIDTLPRIAGENESINYLPHISLVLYGTTNLMNAIALSIISFVAKTVKPADATYRNWHAVQCNDAKETYRLLAHVAMAAWNPSSREVMAELSAMRERFTTLAR